jgi:osmotically-inducible protein OsmY
VTALEVDEAWELLNVAVSAGLLRPATVKLPVASATWDEDHVSFAGVTSAEAWRRELPPVAAPGRTLNAATSVSLPDARLAGAIVETTSLKISELLFKRPWGTFRLDVGRLSFQGGDIRISAQTDTLLPYWNDRELLRVARDALGRARLTDEELLALVVSASDGNVRLSGNVRTPQAREAAVQAVTLALAPVGVIAAITDDLGLESTLSQALFRSGAARGAAVHPRSRLGHVTLYGWVRSAAVAAEAERVVLAVPAVRSVRSGLELDQARA